MQKRLATIPFLRVLQPLGWMVLVVTVVTWVAGARLGWLELLRIAGGGVAVLAVSGLLTVGRSRLTPHVQVDPVRVVAGTAAVGMLSATNRTKRRSGAADLVAAVGTGTARLRVPGLAGGAQHSESFIVDAPLRGIFPVGPVRWKRGDPLGLLSREAVLGGGATLWVHPKTLLLPNTSTGWIRDLEGRTTNDLSMNDVAFHALRDYVPGDDRRHVHWRTSARTGRLMVRQFVDTRRSQLALVLASDPLDYPGDDFELAVSVAGSLGVSALRADESVTVLVGDTPLPAPSPTRLLDGLAGVTLGTPFDATIARAATTSMQASVIAVVCGRTRTLPELRRSVTRLPAGARVLVVRVDPSVPSAVASAGTATIATIPTLGDLPRALRQSVLVR